jgi:hypothetical protein
MSTSDPAPTSSAVPLPPFAASDVLPGGNDVRDPFPPSQPVKAEPVLEWRCEVAVAMWIIAGLALVGVIGGLVWGWAAPTNHYQINDSGQVAVLSTEPEELIALDGWFAIIAVVIGLTAGFRVWWRTRGHEPGAVGGLLVGGLIGSLTMLGTGALLNGGNLDDAASAASGTRLHSGLTVHTPGVLIFMSITGLLLWVVLDLLLPRETAAEPMLAPTFTPPPRHAGERLDSPADRSDAG